MLDFDPSDNVVVAVYGPPEYFETLTDETPAEQPEEDASFFGKLIGLIKKLIDFLNGLFTR